MSATETVLVNAAALMAYETAAADSFLTNNTTTTAYDDYFEYKLTDPVTIRKHESALVPSSRPNSHRARHPLVALTATRPPSPLDHKLQQTHPRSRQLLHRRERQLRR